MHGFRFNCRLGRDPGNGLQLPATDPSPTVLDLELDDDDDDDDDDDQFCGRCSSLPRDPDFHLELLNSPIKWITC